jgi:hypothetical protein
MLKAKIPGDWIFPDAIEAPALAAIARNCPSRRLTKYRQDSSKTRPPQQALYNEHQQRGG